MAEGKTSEVKKDDAEVVYTAEQIKSHNKENDCWIVINGNVYDATKYLDEHPGGPEIIHDVAGQVATAEFEDTGHSEEAREILKRLYKGKADPSMEETVASSSSSSGSKDEGPSFLMIVAVLVALASAAYLLYEPSENKTE